jgi:hypothetical protein
MQPDLTLVAGARVDLHHTSVGIFGIRPGGSVGGDLFKFWEVSGYMANLTGGWGNDRQSSQFRSRFWDLFNYEAPSGCHKSCKALKAFLL